MKNRIDLDTEQSDHSGLKGYFERFMRRFKLVFHSLMLLPLYLVASLCLGVCLVPGIYLFRYAQQMTMDSTPLVQDLSYGCAIAAGYFLYGFSLIFLAPLVNMMIGGKLKEWRGPYYSVETFRWFLHNGLTYLVRYTFLEFVTPTPVSNLFFSMMGMKIGNGVIINTSNISDPSLIELSDKVTIGGSVTILAHYGQGGLMVIAPVKIGPKVTIGLKASIMGGVEIGEGAKILPHSVVMPKTIIPAGETWGGVPAQKIEKEEVPLKLVKAS